MQGGGEFNDYGVHLLVGCFDGRAFLRDAEDGDEVVW